MDTLTTLFKHNLWANLRLLECCAPLTPEQLDASRPGAFGTINAILQHIVSSEQSYFARISTGQPIRRPAERPVLTMPQMAESLQHTGEGFIEWAQKVQPGDIVHVDWDGSPRDVPKAIIFTQVINHSTEHREQIKAVLTEIGVEAPDLQSWAYFEEIDK